MKPMYIFFFRKKIFYDVTNFIFGRSLLKYILNKLVDGKKMIWDIPSQGYSDPPATQKYLHERSAMS